MCSVTWTHFLIMCLGFEVAGAVAIAWSLARNTAAKIAATIPLRGSPLGWFDPDLIVSPTPLPGVARDAARQRAEARLGIGFLGGGLVGQAGLYFLPVSIATLENAEQRLIGAGLVLAVALIAISVYRLYVPWSTNRIFDDAKSQEPSGSPAQESQLPPL